MACFRVIGIGRPQYNTLQPIAASVLVIGRTSHKIGSHTPYTLTTSPATRSSVLQAYDSKALLVGVAEVVFKQSQAWEDYDLPIYHPERPKAFRPGKTFNLMEADFTEAIRQKLGASHSQFLELRRHIGEDVPETLGNDDDDAKKVGFSTMREHDVCHFMHVYFEA